MLMKQFLALTLVGFATSTPSFLKTASMEIYQPVEVSGEVNIVP